jgi:hypothetical protein
MAETDLTLVLEILRRVQEEVRDIKNEVREHTRRFGRIERQLAGIVVTEADESTRMDQLTERVERLERRLELRD